MVAEETEPTLPKGRVWAFVRAVPIFVQLHWFRLVQIGSDWLWRELQVFATDKQRCSWWVGFRGRRVGKGIPIQYNCCHPYSIVYCGSKGE